jgi:predicted nicotinamide N-methyase
MSGALPCAANSDAEEEEAWCEWRRGTQSWRARFADECVLDLRASGGAVVRVAQAASAGAAHGRRDGDASADPGVTGSTVWDGALVLAAYLSRRSTVAAMEARLGRPCASVLELGAGTGLAGLALAASGALPRGAAVALTDLAPLCDFLRSQLARNAQPLAAKSRVLVAPLRWGDADAAAAAAAATCGDPDALHVDCVIGADLCYRRENVSPLLAALTHLVRPGGVAVLALDTSHCPEAVQDFTARAASGAPDASCARFDVRRVPRAELHATYRCADVRVLQLWRCA